MASGFSLEEETTPWLHNLYQSFQGLLITSSTTGPQSSKDDLESLQQKIGPYATYKPISCFYHVTKVLPKMLITSKNKLCGSLAKMTQSPSSLSPIHGRLSGVFFSCNLSKRGYSLPDSSPFGSERIKIPITEFTSAKMHLFYNSHHNNGRIYYVILVLAKESDPKYQFCQDHMIELDMASNHFLRLDFRRNKFDYCDPSGFTLWVELFVLGDVSLHGINHTWDKVIETGRNRSQPHPARQHHLRALYGFYDTTTDSDDDDDFP